MPWYYLTTKQQIGYAHILNRLQNGTTLQIGPFAALNFEKFTNVSFKYLNFILSTQKTIYLFR